MNRYLTALSNFMPQEDQRQPMQLPLPPQYDPNQQMTNPLGIKMNRGTADFLKDFSYGLGQATDNPILQAMGYANQNRDKRGSHDPQLAQQHFENAVTLRKLQNDEKAAGRKKWQLGTMYDDNGREQKIMYNENDPSEYKPLGGSKAKDINFQTATIYDRSGQPITGVFNPQTGQLERTIGGAKAKDDFGFSVQAPDGTVVSYGKGGPIQKPTANDLEKKVVQTGETMSRLRDMQRRFDDDFLTFQGQADAWMQRMKEKAGVGLEPQQQQRVAEFSAFQRDVTNNLSLYLNQLSGAAISPAEFDRISQTLPNMDDSPTQFRAKWGGTMRELSKAQARAKWALQNGVGQNPWDSDAQFEKAVETRGDQIAQQIRQQNPQATDEQIKQAVTNQIRMEFGF
jgi:hypothetical protein